MHQTSIYDFYPSEKEYIPSTVFFKHPSLYTKYDKVMDTYSIHASEDIWEGQLLMVEQGFVGDEQMIIQELQKPQHRKIVQDLYPRNQSVFDCLRKKNKTWYREKLKHNSWEHYETGDDIKMKKWECLFPYISRFNHSCSPTAGICRILSPNNTSTQYKIYFAVIATLDINEGDEIELCYGDNIGHGHTVFNWKCECGLYFNERKHLFSHNIKKAEHYVIDHVDTIEEIILEGEEKRI